MNFSSKENSHFKNYKLKSRRKKREKHLISKSFKKKLMVSRTSLTIKILTKMIDIKRLLKTDLNQFKMEMSLTLLLKCLKYLQETSLKLKQLFF